MLTRLDLAILRAALQFFDEELSPHGRAAVQPYFGMPLTESFNLRVVDELRARLRHGQMRYLVCDRNAQRARSLDLIRSASRARATAVAVGAHVGTVLILPELP